MNKNEMQKPIKHKSDKTIIKQLYLKFNKSIYSLINQTGNLFEIVLEEDADFEKISGFIKEFEEKQNEYSDYEAFILGDGFSMIWLYQKGNNNEFVISINAKHQRFEFDYNGRLDNFTIIQLRGEDTIDVYRGYRQMEILRKYKGEWFMHGWEEWAKTFGDFLENDSHFKEGRFRIQNYKKWGED